MLHTSTDLDAAWIAAENARVLAIVENSKAKLADIAANPAKYRNARIARERAALATLADAIIKTLSLPGEPMAGPTGLAVCDAAYAIFQDSILETREEIEADYQPDYAEHSSELAA